MSRIVPTVRDVKRLANPSSTVSQASGNKAPTIVLLMAAVIGIQSFRDKSWPSGHMLLSDAIVVGVFLLVASLAPEDASIVVWLLLVALLYLALTNAALLEGLTAKLTSAVNLGGRAA